MKAEIAVISFNESKNIQNVINALTDVRERLKLIVDFSILFINNGSTDDTEEVITGIEKTSDFIRHITISENKGYGYGVKRGLEKANGDIVGFMWGDNQFDALIVEKLVKSFIDNPAVQLVKTFRIKRLDGRLRLWISAFYQLLFKLLYGVYTRDINSGPKLFRTELLKQISPFRSDDWFIDAEIMIKTSRLVSSNQIIEFPITFLPRQHGKSNVRFSACFQFLSNLIKYKFIKL